MTPQCKALCNRLAESIVKRDFDAAHGFLAPWFGNLISPSQLEQMVDTATEGLAHLPHSWSIDEGMAELADLRSPDGFGPPSQVIPGEITSANFRGWLNIQFAPDPAVQDEQNVSYDLWLVAVEHEGRILAGYLEAAEPA